MNRLIWSEEQLETLKELWLITSNSKLSKLFDCSPTSVVNKAKELGLPSKKRKTFKWTKEQEQFLVINWHLLPYSKLVEELGCSRGVIQKKVKELGLAHKSRKYGHIPNIPAIYKLSFKGSGKFYIGMTCSLLRKRFVSHLSELRNRDHCNLKLQKEFDKYGENAVQCEVIQELEPHTSNYKALEIESYWINKLNPELNILKHKIGEMK